MRLGFAVALMLIAAPASAQKAPIPFAVPAMIETASGEHATSEAPEAGAPKPDNEPKKDESGKDEPADESKKGEPGKDESEKKKASSGESAPSPDDPLRF